MKTIPARIHLLPARSSPRVVVIRRKPSKVAHVMRWNTLTDEIEHGSWFHGRIYEMRSDVSHDGEWMVYLAMGNGTWTGICHPPFLRTTVHWENMGTWNGGGVFTAPNLLEANAGYAVDDMKKALKDLPQQLPFRIVPMKGVRRGEDEGVLYPRMARDGYRRVGPPGREVRSAKGVYTMVCEDDPGWVYAPTKRHPELRIRYRGYYSGRGRVFEFDLPEEPGLLDPEVTWAAYDSLGQLVFARRGVLLRYTLEGIRSRTPDAVIDLEHLVPPVRDPNKAGYLQPEPNPPVRAVGGRLEDQPVKTLILPTASIPWASRIRLLAGDLLMRDLADIGDETYAFLTPAYYLRQHEIVHVPEPQPEEGEERLLEVSRQAFGIAATGSATSVALIPIGIASGFPPEVASKVTEIAAYEYVAEDVRREVLIVDPANA